MFKKFTLADILIFLAAFSSLIFSEILFFTGGADEKIQAIFMGLWVPSILAFGIYMNLIQKR